MNPKLALAVDIAEFAVRGLLFAALLAAAVAVSPIILTVLLLTDTSTTVWLRLLMAEFAVVILPMSVLCFHTGKEADVVSGVMGLIAVLMLLAIVFTVHD